MNEPMFWAWWGWEPLRFYHYMKGQAAGVTGLAQECLDDWYEQLHSEDVAKAAAELGINWAVTHFVKGFGLDYEKEEIARTAALTSICHRYGIKVFGYLQYGTILHETFFQECPQAKDWIQLDEAGAPQLWCGSPLRFLPCIHADEHHQYLRECIRRGLQDIGLDGLHFDNFYSRPCYCPRCRQEFRAYANAEIPPESALANEPHHDPVVRQWIRFRCDRLASLMEEISRFARAIKPDVKLIWNPSPIRGTLNQAALRGTDFRQLGPRAGILWSESGNFPGCRDGRLIHQVNFFKTAEAIGYQTFSTTWMRGAEGLGLPQTAAEIALNTAESAAFGAVPGSNWLLRPSHLHDLLSQGPLSCELKRNLDFIRRHADVFVGSQGDGEVTLFLDHESPAWEFSRSYGAFLAVQELLLRRHVTFDLVFSESAARRRPERLVLRISSRRLHDGISDPARVLDISGALGPASVSGSYQAAVAMTPEMEQESERIIAALGQREVTVSAPETVFVEARRTADQRRVLHCLNYDNQSASARVSVAFLTPPAEVQALSPDREAVRLIPSHGRIELPPVATWAVLVWNDQA